MSLLRHYFSDKRVRQRCKMLRFDIVPVLCLIFGLLVQSPKIVKADPQHGVAFPDGKTCLIYFFEEKWLGKFGMFLLKFGIHQVILLAKCKKSECWSWDDKIIFLSG